VVGELLAGVLLGPSLLDVLAPEPVLGAIARLGLVGFLFAAGLELDLSLLRKRSLAVAASSLLGIAVPFALGFGVVHALPTLFLAPCDPVADVGRTALLVGTALSISALPVIARVFGELGLSASAFASLVLAAATIDDLVGWSLFTVIAGGGAASSVRALLVLGVSFLAAVAVGRPLAARLRPFVRRRLAKSTSAQVTLGALLALLGASLVERLGGHGLFGAFLAGLVLSRPGTAEPVRDATRSVAVGLLAPLYFASVGLKVDLRGSFDIRLVAIVMLVACLGKVLGAGLGARLGGLGARESVAVGFALNARGAMEIVLASLAWEQGLVDERLFVALVVVALATSALAAPALRRLLGAEDATRGDDGSVARALAPATTS
jgi:Kef-type K+ transport system membrane component KefB